ncbi:MAG: hypothetical protein M3547_01055 [Acidobacteriota bacterium]|nr:hypothetical protein [Acidobacteriota bacterium]
MAGVAAARRRPPTIEVQSTDLVERGRAIAVIETREQYEAAVAILRDNKAMLQAIDDHHEPMRLKTKAAYDSVLEARSKLRKPHELLERTLKALGSAFLTAEERARKQEEARLLGERRREEEEARLAQAGALEDAGEHAAAEAVVSQPINVAPAVLERPKVQGASTRKSWKYRVTNRDLIPDEWFDRLLAEKRLAAYVSSVGDQATIPGIEIYEEIGMAVRA